jgi:hypothetical protein
VTGQSSRHREFSHSELGHPCTTTHPRQRSTSLQLWSHHLQPHPKRQTPFERRLQHKKIYLPGSPVFDNEVFAVQLNRTDTFTPQSPLQRLPFGSGRFFRGLPVYANEVIRRPRTDTFTPQSPPQRLQRKDEDPPLDFGYPFRVLLPVLDDSRHQPTTKSPFHRLATTAKDEIRVR